MRFTYFNLGRAGLCLAIWLYGAPGEAAPPCGRTGSIYKCSTEDSTYRFRMPDVVYPDYRTPVVVILHDAGRSGAAIINDQRLIEAFIEKGYAVLAPDALPRRNLRFRYLGKQVGLVRGMMQGHPIRYSKEKFVMTGIDGSIRVLKYKDDTGWYYFNIDQAVYSGKRPKTEYIGRNEIQRLRSILRELEEEYGIGPKSALVIGLGRGGSLVWQIACYAPNFGQILAPVGGAFWRKIPTNCKSVNSDLLVLPMPSFLKHFQHLVNYRKNQHTWCYAHKHTFGAQFPANGLISCAWNPLATEARHGNVHRQVHPRSETGVKAL